MHLDNQNFARMWNMKSFLQMQTFSVSDNFPRVFVDMLPQGECFFSGSDLWPEKSLFPREPLTKERVAHNRRDSRRFSYDKFRHCLLPYASHQIWLEKIPPSASPQASGQDMVSYLGKGSQHLFSSSVTKNALNGLVSDAVPWDCLILLLTI